MANSDKNELINWELVATNPSDKSWNWKDLFCYWGVNIQSVIGFSLITSLYIIYDLIELFLSKNILPKSYNFFDYFKNEINKTKKFNLDEESLFIKFKSKLLNG